MTRSLRHDGGSLYSPTGERKYLTPAERERFLAAVWACPRSDLRTLALTLALTGCRISEALGLRAGAVQRDARCLALRSLKRRNGAVVIREVPVPDHLLYELERVHDLTASDPTQRLWPLSRSRGWQLIKTLMVHAGIPPGLHMTPKGLRHGYGLHAIRSGIPLTLLQKWLGHAKLSTTAIYAQAMGDEERELAARMWRNEGQPTPQLTRDLPMLPSLPIAFSPWPMNGRIISGFAPSMSDHLWPCPAIGKSLPIATSLATRWRWALVQVS